MPLIYPAGGDRGGSDDRRGGEDTSAGQRRSSGGSGRGCDAVTCGAVVADHCPCGRAAVNCAAGAGRERQERPSFTGCRAASGSEFRHGGGAAAGQPTGDRGQQRDETGSGEYTSAGRDVVA